MSHLDLIQQLRAERLKLGLSQYAVADLMDDPHMQTVTRLEGGKTAPRIDTFLRWATALGFKVTLEK